MENIKKEILSIIKNHFKKSLTSDDFSLYFGKFRINLIDDSILYCHVDSVLAKEGINNLFKKEITDILYEEFQTNYEIITEVSVKEQNSFFETNLNASSTLENYFVDKSNELAYSIANNVKKILKERNCFIYIYGKPGVGKTHLLHAIGNDIYTNLTKKVLYLPADVFVKQFISLINSKKDNSLDEFESMFTDIDVLLMDDIQFLSGKKKSLEKLFEIYEKMMRAKKTIILVSDCEVTSLDHFHERLKSRFLSDLRVEINEPTSEIMKNVLVNKISKENISLFDDECIDYIVKKSNKDIRTLNGNIQTLLFYLSIGMFDLITIDNINKVLKITNSSKTKVISNEKIIKLVSKELGVSQKLILANNKEKEIVYARDICIYLIRDLTEVSLQRIAVYFNKSHVSINNSFKKVDGLIQDDELTREFITKLKLNLQ